uniref:Uncharacterized protein n=1 Tax=Callithrix jacchus TaxID=9483 RepID=A0A8I3WKB2_CALJA
MGIRAEVEWHDLGSLRPAPTEVRQSSCLSLLSSWDHRYMPRCPANIFVLFIEMGFCNVAKASLKLLSSSALPVSATQSAGIAGQKNFLF